MHYLSVAALLFAFLPAPSTPPVACQTGYYHTPTYILPWTSTTPIAGVDGASSTGSDPGNYAALDGRSGCLVVTFERACLTIRGTLHPNVANGKPIAISRTWDKGCARLYAPMVTR